MIVKKVANPDKSSSKAERVRALTNYIRAPEKENHTEKCVFAGARGFICQTPHAQQREMIALAQAAVRSPDPISHWILSWREGEQPTPAQIEEIVTTFLSVMGLVDHQVVYGLHADTDNWHLHLAINRVHPVTEKVVKPNRGFDKEAAHRAIAEIEARQGWAREAGARYVTLENGEIARAGSEERAEPSQRARDFEHRFGEKSAERIGIEAVPDILARATSWYELHHLMSIAGLRYEQKGSGAIIWVGDQPIKASAAARDASLKKLIARFGPYEPGRDAKPLEAHPVEPLHLPPAPGWAEYEKIRHDHLRAKQAAEADLQRRIQADKEKLRATNRAERQAALGVGSWTGRGRELNELRSAIAAQQAIALAEMQDLHRYQRAELKRKFRPVPDFDAWLASQRRDEDEVALWRDRQNWPGEIVGPDGSMPTPRDIRAFVSISRDGAVHYSRRDGSRDDAFVDRGRVITIYDWRDADSLQAALQLSAAKWPAGFIVKGNDEYLRACVKLAAEHGFKIVNPELQEAIAKERTRLQEARQQAKQGQQQRVFEQYDAAVGADRYRLTAERRRNEGPNTLFLIDGKGAGARGLASSLVPQHIPALLTHQRRGDGVFYTPISDHRHHIIIKGLTAANLDRLRAEGYRPAYIANTAPALFEAIINVEKLGSAFDDEAGDKLARRLNETYGDGGATSAIARHCAPAFANFLTAHHQSGDSFPLVTLESAQRCDCPRAFSLSRQIEEEIRRAAKSQRLAAEATVTNIVAPSAAAESASIAAFTAKQIYARHHRDIVASMNSRQRVDPSRIDLAIAIRLRVTGHTRDQIVDVLSAGATKAVAANERRDLSRYVRRTANAAYRPTGSRLAERNQVHRDRWLDLERLGRQVRLPSNRAPAWCLSLATEAASLAIRSASELGAARAANDARVQNERDQVPVTAMAATERSRDDAGAEPPTSPNFRRREPARRDSLDQQAASLAIRAANELGAANAANDARLEEQRNQALIAAEMGAERSQAEAGAELPTSRGDRRLEPARRDSLNQQAASLVIRTANELGAANAANDARLEEQRNQALIAAEMGAERSQAEAGAELPTSRGDRRLEPARRDSLNQQAASLVIRTANELGAANAANDARLEEERNQALIAAEAVAERSQAEAGAELPTSRGGRRREPARRDSLNQQAACLAVRAADELATAKMANDARLDEESNRALVAALAISAEHARGRDNFGPRRTRPSELGRY